MDVKIKLIENGKLPNYKTSGSAGGDCYARLDKAFILKPGERKTIPLGFAVEIPEGYEMQIRGRSGLASKNGIDVFIGTIDSDYRGEVGAILINKSSEDFIINPGDRIAQEVICPIIKADWCTVDELSSTERGTGGFGSTGKNDDCEKFYEPFKTIEEVEPYFQKVVKIGEDECIVKSAKYVPSIVGEQLVISFIDTKTYKENSFNSLLAYNVVRLNGHCFGKEIK